MIIFLMFFAPLDLMILTLGAEIFFDCNSREILTLKSHRYWVKKFQDETEL
jgi:hypothetical protein